MTNQPDYAALLAVWEREKEELEAAIALARRKLGLDSSLGSETVNGGPDRVRSDSFYRLGIAEAAVAYLRMTNRTPKTSAEIAGALDRGGLVHQSKDLKATVNALLIRDHAKWKITRLPNGAWGLEEWYPAGRSKKIKATKGREQPEDEETEEATEESDEQIPENQPE